MDSDKTFIGAFAIAFVVWLTFVSVIAFVAYHFIAKFW